MTRVPSRRRRQRALSLLCLAALGGAACSPQRLPSPMAPATVPLPPGESGLVAPGPQQVDVMRHADPVRIRRPGAPGAFTLPFYDKDVRLGAGGWVETGAGGRAEVTWPGRSTSAWISDSGVAVVGEPSRDEPVLLFLDVERARLILNDGERVQLMGGALLSGSEEGESGPFLIERKGPEIVRVRNQSKTIATVAYRDATIALSPGQIADLPLLEGGTSPERVPGDASSSTTRRASASTHAATSVRTAPTTASSSSAPARARSAASGSRSPSGTASASSSPASFPLRRRPATEAKGAPGR